jgi:hypothetical protein
MMIAKKTEGPLSGYEPDPFEVIAEAFRVFVWNPQLLGLTFPRRYETLITYGLKPLPMSSGETLYEDLLVTFSQRKPRFAELCVRKTADTCLAIELEAHR